MALLPYAPPRPEEEQEEYSASAYPSFNPTLTSEQTQEYIKEYEENPRVFEPNILEVLGQHATHYKVPFAYNEEDQEASIGSVIKNIGQGFMEGFTTLPLAGKSKPTNEWEAIGSNLGHLAGFVGYIPGASLVTKLPRLAGIARAVKGRSLPMIAARAATEKAAKISNRVLNSAKGARAAASGDAISFLQKPLVKDLVEGSFHLGVASSVSSVWGGVDEMMKSFIGGAETGLAFRGIGNLIKGFGPQGDKALRALASSLYTGLPATQAGMTTPEQIYEYVLGAYFGMNEMPYHRRQGGKFIQQKVLRGKHEGKPLEAIPGWEKLDTVTQKWVEKQPAVVDRPLGLPVAGEVAGIFYDKDTGELITDPARIERGMLELAEKIETGETPFKKLVETDEQYVNKTEGTHDYSSENLDFEPVDIIKNKIKYYVDEHKAIYTVADKPDRGKRLEAYQNVQGKWNELIETFRANEKETGEGFIKEKGDHPEEFIRKYITKTYGVSTAEDYNFWRNWGNRQLREEFVPQMSVIQRNNGKYDTINMEDNVSYGKTERIIKEERKYVEDIWERANEMWGRPVPRGRAYKILDHVSVQSENISKRTGQYGVKDYSFKEWKERFSDDPQGEAAYLREKAKMNSFNYKMQDAEGYYYYGGKSDAQRQYFLRYHPALMNATPQMIKAKVRDIVKGAGGVKFLKALEKDRIEFINTYGVKSANVEGLTKKEASDLYNKAFLSNIYYTYEMNGKTIEASVGKVQPKDFADVFPSANNKVVGNAKAFNKRQQIWFTSGISATRSFMEKQEGLGAEDGTFRYIYVNDKDGTTSKEYQAALKKTDPAFNWKESEDGGVIGRSDWLEALNRDAGIPTDGGFNKSFIVSPSASQGALLGKYGVHRASPKIDAWMKKNNVHFIMNTSSAKQAGRRVAQDYELAGDELKFGPKGKDDAVIHQMPVGDVKTVYSEIASIETSLKDTRVPKQLLSNLTPYAWTNINTESIKDMYEAINQKAMIGEAEANALLERFTNDPIANEAMIETLIERMDGFGLPKLLEAMHGTSKPEQKFASQVYEKILKINREIESDKVLEGEITPDEAQESIREMYEFNAIHERLVRLLPDSLASQLHKFTNPIRGAAIRNFVVNQVTRPKLGNSGSFRFRIWDKEMQQRTDKEGNTSLLAKNDNIFFLDEGWKDLRIKTDFGKQDYTLSELWDAVRNKETGIPLAKAKEVLNAVVVRTPMDSLSGAQVLEFRGFTGVKGVSGLMHPRKTRALGGADLDGDKAAVFFGDEVHGMRKEWKKMYKDQADEYVLKNGSEASNKEAEYKDLFAEPDSGGVNEAMSNPALLFSSHRRQLASEAAAQGRGMLGIAVTTRASIVGAHAAVASLPARVEKVEVEPGQTLSINVPKGHYLYQIHTGYGKTRWVTAKALTDAKSLDAGRKSARAAVAVGSDPMDEAGLKGRGAFFDGMANQVFEWKAYHPKVIKGKLKLDTVETNKLNSDADYARAQRRKPIQLFQGANSALYGRHYQQKRRYYYNEVRDRLDAITDPSRMLIRDVKIKGRPTKRIRLYTPGFGEENRNTLLGKVAADVRQLDYGDSLFNRVDKRELAKIYVQHQADVEDGKYNWLQKALNRTSMRIPESDVVEDIFSRGLHTYDGYRRELNIDRWDLGLTPETNYTKRAAWLADYVKKGEDFLVNDMSDVVSFRLIRKYADQVGDQKRVLEIHKETERFKRKSDDFYRKSREGITAKGIQEEHKARGEEISEKESLRLYEAERDIAKEGESPIANKTKLDNMMKVYKSEILKTAAERNLFDQMMLGTFERGTAETVKTMKKTWSEESLASKPVQEYLATLEERSKQTHLSRVGFGSTAVSDASLKEYLNSYDKLFNKTAVRLTDKEIQRLGEEGQAAVDVKSIVDENGDRVKIQSINTNNLDRTEQKYIDEIAPFEGLTKGKLKKEEAELAASIIDHISNNFGKELIGVEFNKFVRGVMEKDMNAMTFRDWKAFNNYLQEIRDGSFLARHMGTMKHPERFPELAKRHQYLFPEAINKELMRYEIKRIETIGTFKDKRGNIVTGKVTKPTQIINEIRDLYHKSQERTSAVFDQNKKLMEDELGPYLYGLEDGSELYRVSGAMMERFGRVRMDDNLNKAPLGGYLAELNRELAGEPGKHKAAMSEYSRVFREAIKSSDWHNLKKKTYIVKHKIGKKTVTQSLSGFEVVERMIEQRTKQNERYHKWLTGDKVLADKYLGELESVLPEKGDKAVAKIRIKQLGELRDTFLKDVQKMSRLNEDIPMELGIDNLRKITRYLQIHQLAQEGKLASSGLVRALETVPSEIIGTGTIKYESYVPHMMFDRKEASESMLRYIQSIAKDPRYGDDVKKREYDLKSAIIRFKQLTGDWVSSDQLTESWNDVSKVLSGIGREKKALLDEGFNQFMKNRRVGNQFKRETHIGGWSYEPQAYETYVKNIIGSFNKQIAEIGARDATYQFRKDYIEKGVDKELVHRWGDYLDLYSQEAGGAPVNIPKHILNDPSYGVKGTAYAWFADNLWVKRMNRLREKLGLDKRKRKGPVTITQEAEEVAPIEYKWSRYAPTKEKYEVSTAGDKRFSALNARLEDGRTIEEHYQVDVKGYASIKEGKGKSPKDAGVNLYGEYKKLWNRWAKQNPDLINDLAGKAANKTLTDKFASTDVSQARALSEILNARAPKPKATPKKTITISGDVPKELDTLDFSSLRKFGQLEAKYQLASLLAHPKSMVANLYGGTVHTLISTGYENFKNARSIKYLKLKVNPEWDKMEDVYDWVKSHGVVEEFLMYEANINPQVQSKAWQRTINETVRALKNDPDIPDKNILRIASKNGISESIFNKAAWFMRRPERTLRRDAFVAHYLKASEKFGGMISDYNNPTLIEMAKKGVKGTQFLYSAPFRPAFSRSNVGKVYSRFQTWAWNSVRFRNDVLREAKIRGFNPGTDEFDRLKRLAVADMFMLGLANMFPYSIFEAALPSPWNWFEDTAAMMFGDERERDRAFFGTYPAPLQPLQVITPPALRLLPPLFKGMVTDDYTRLSEYYLWTMIPFGRILRDVVGPGSILENPARSVEKLTGLPYMGFARTYKAEQEEEKRGPRGLLNYL